MAEPPAASPSADSCHGVGVRKTHHEGDPGDGDPRATRRLIGAAGLTTVDGTRNTLPCTEKHGTEKHGTEKHGTEKHGTEKHGTENYRMSKDSSTTTDWPSPAPIVRTPWLTWTIRDPAPRHRSCSSS